MTTVTHDARLDAWLDAHLEESLTELERLVAQPSVSARDLGIAECADLVAAMLRRRGFTSEVVPTAGAPVVLASRRGTGPKTLLVYNHYDVQPPEPLEEWTSPPFEPARREGRLYGRGASDDKGHLVARLFAIDAWLAVHGELPCTITFVIEGEEETGGAHLPGFIRDHRDRLRADACLWEFGYVDERDVPMLFGGLRGICYVELSVRTASRDAHSGLGGSVFPNAAWRLVWALESLKGPDERIRIAGFHDRVRPPSARDLELLEALPDTADEWRRSYALAGFVRGLEGGPELRRAATFEPTCTICGLTSGYQLAGSKTVQPALASAKVDFRLVPDQRPEDVLAQLRAHLDAHGFADVEIECLGRGTPARTDPDHPFLTLVADTAEPVYGAAPRLVPMSGASGPNHPFIHDLGLPVATAGLGYPGSQVHAPNENIRIDLYLKHARHVARLIGAFA